MTSCLLVCGRLALRHLLISRTLRITAIGIVACLIAFSSAHADEPTLKEAYKDDFKIGVALGGNLPDDYTDKELAVIKAHFNAVTPENCMKPFSLHPEENQWAFAQSDALVEFAEANHMQVTGHNLVWHEQTPGWFFDDNGKPASRDKLLERMKTHIQTVVGRYKGRIHGWDVVNEAVAEGGSGDLRRTSWSKGIGDDYIIQAYQFAHEADPGMDLQYNDYNDELPAKRAKTIRLIKNLQAAGLPIASVGIQGHWMLDKVPFKDIEDSIDEYQKLGIKVMFTEVDLDVVPRQSTGADISKKETDDTIDGLNSQSIEERLKRQAEQYAQLFELFHKHRDCVTRVTFWGLNDGRSWLNYWPRERTNYPLLFDRQSQPKPALASIIDVVAKQPK